MEKYSKITVGFVIQSYEQKDGKYVWVGQEFEASDQVDREDLENNPIEIDETEEVYFPFHMKQPE
jgi:hypothetical protein